jgi:hypothetical protein
VSQLASFTLARGAAVLSNFRFHNLRNTMPTSYCSARGYTELALRRRSNMAEQVQAATKTENAISVLDERVQQIFNLKLSERHACL